MRRRGTSQDDRRAFIAVGLSVPLTLWAMFAFHAWDGPRPFVGFVGIAVVVTLGLIGVLKLLRVP